MNYGVWYKLVLGFEHDLQGVEWVLDRGYLPQAVIRYGIRRQLEDRIRTIQTTSLEEAYKFKMRYVKALRTKPMAIETAAANFQHYEVGTGILKACLGPRMKYSCCFYPTGKETLGQAEVRMLETYVEKAQMADGMRILDLGCGRKSPDIVSITDIAIEAAAGVLQPFTSLRSFPMLRSLHFPIQEPKKHISTNKRLLKVL